MTKLIWPGRWLIVWLGATALLGLWLVRFDISQRREAFQSSAGMAHRLLSQRAAQQDAILATLVLLGPASAGDHPAARLPSLYPQILQVWQRPMAGTWPEPALADAEDRSRAAGRPALALVAGMPARYDLVLAGSTSSFGLRIELSRWADGSDWPFQGDRALGAELRLGGQTLTLQAPEGTGAWRGGVTPGFVFQKVLDTPSQPFVLQLQRSTGPADWPWPRLVMLAAALGVLTVALAALQRQRARRRRAEHLLRVSRTSRLNALGQLAGGMAHEINQPLTAVIASTQAARRMLDEEELPQAQLHEALTQASQQARRAASVVARLRRLVEQPGSAAQAQPMDLGEALRSALTLLQPDLQRLALRPQIKDEGLMVLADPVALEQILHNLLGNALQAMETVPQAQRSLQLQVSTEGGRGVLRLRDGGPGLAPEVLAHLFEPFFSTKAEGLGLGLSLCEALASAMGGTLSAQNAPNGGAEFQLQLPLAPDA